MSENMFMFFVVIYGLAFFLLLGSIIAGLIKGKTKKLILKEAMPSLSIILGSLVLWFVYISVVGELRSIF